MKRSPWFLVLLSLLAIPTVASASEPGAGMLVQMGGLGFLVVTGSAYLLSALWRDKKAK